MKQNTVTMIAICAAGLISCSQPSGREPAENPFLKVERDYLEQQNENNSEVSENSGSGNSLPQSNNPKNVTSEQELTAAVNAFCADDTFNLIINDYQENQIIQLSMDTGEFCLSLSSALDGTFYPRPLIETNENGGDHISATCENGYLTIDHISPPTTYSSTIKIRNEICADLSNSINALDL